MKKSLRIFMLLILCTVILAGCGKSAGLTVESQPMERDAATVSSDSGITATEQGIAVSAAAVDVTADAMDVAADAMDMAAGAGNNAEKKDTAGKLDQYQTAPAPAGKPDPVEPQNEDINKKTKYHCTLSITCSTILDHMDDFDQAKLEVLPEDGEIYPAKEVVFYEGESVFDVLLRETKENKTHMEFVDTPIYNSNYIEGINNIYEFDCGELSGWMYKVNGWFPNYGCSRYQLIDGDEVEWVYTCDLGKDVGGDWNAQKSGAGKKEVQ